MSYENRVNLGHNEPTPYRPGAIIKYTLPRKERINLSIYNLTGQLISSLVDGHQDPGSYSVYFNADQLPTGKYIYILRAGERYHSDVMTV